jgi:hypothetical protein
MADKIDLECHKRLAALDAHMQHLRTDLDEHRKNTKEELDSCNKKIEEAMAPVRGAKTLLWLGAIGTALGTIATIAKKWL